MTTISRRITKFITMKGYEFEQPEPDLWIVNIDTQTSNFNVQIFLPDSVWILFTSFPMKNVQGRNSGQFYELLLSLSYSLNGFKFGISQDGTYITLQTEWSQAELDYEMFDGIVSQFVYIYEDWYPQLLQEAHSMNLKLVAGRRKSLEARLKSFTSADSSYLVRGPYATEE